MEFRIEQQAERNRRRQRNDPVAADAQSVHPVGQPISHSTN
jgi:hypothetical protein